MKFNMEDTFYQLRLVTRVHLRRIYGWEVPSTVLQEEREQALPWLRHYRD